MSIIEAKYEEPFDSNPRYQYMEFLANLHGITFRKNLDEMHLREEEYIEKLEKKVGVKRIFEAILSEPQFRDFVDLRYTDKDKAEIIETFGKDFTVDMNNVYANITLRDSIERVILDSKLTLNEKKALQSMLHSACPITSGIEQFEALRSLTYNTIEVMQNNPSLTKRQQILRVMRRQIKPYINKKYNRIRLITFVVDVFLLAQSIAIVQAYNVQRNNPEAHPRQEISKNLYLAAIVGLVTVLFDLILVLASFLGKADWAEEYQKFHVYSIHIWNILLGSWVVNSTLAKRNPLKPAEQDATDHPKLRILGIVALSLEVVYGVYDAYSLLK